MAHSFQFTKVYQCRARGKPSTWLPRENLGEQKLHPCSFCKKLEKISKTLSIFEDPRVDRSDCFPYLMVAILRTCKLFCMKSLGFKRHTVFS